MSSSWGIKLEKKLIALADSASKESIQTLAKWIGFNRKHALSFATILQESFTKQITIIMSSSSSSGSEQRYWMYWSLVHEVLILNVNTPKWDKLLELRTILGETTILKTVQITLKEQGNNNNIKLLPDNRFDTYLKEWDNYNVFSGPTMLSQIRKLLTSSSTTTSNDDDTTNNGKEVNSTTTTTTTIKNDSSSPKKNDEETASIKKEDTIVDTNSNKDKTNSSQQSTTVDPATTTITTTTTNDKETKMEEPVEMSTEPTTTATTSTTEPSTNDIKTEQQQQSASSHTKTTTGDNDETLTKIDKDDDKTTTTKNDEKMKIDSTTATTSTNNEATTTKDGKEVEIIPSSKTQRRTSFNLNKEIVYDFESKNIPQGKVESREILDPCKAIATLQIARDLRNDAAVQLSSLLSSIPNDIKKVCEENQQQKQKQQGEGDEDEEKSVEKEQVLTNDKARDYSIRISQSILDMDIEEQIDSIKTFRDIVQRQRTARKQLIYLLIKSRCQFGSIDTANMYYELQNIIKLNQKSKDLLSDAMDLEGLDYFMDTGDERKEIKKDDNKEEGLPPLTWYTEYQKKKQQDEEAKEKESSNDGKKRDSSSLLEGNNNDEKSNKKLKA